MSKSEKNLREIRLTDEEIHILLSLLRLTGFREKRETPDNLRNSRTEMNVIVGRIIKKLRKADHFAQSS